MTLLFIYLSIALLVSFLCSVLEAVLLSSTDSYIESLSKTKSSDTVDKLRKLRANIDNPISSILILNTFAHTMGAAGVGAQALFLFGEQWETIIAFILTLLILYFSEIIPKTIGAVYWKKLLIPSFYIIMFLIKLLYPFVWFSTFITKFLSKNKEKSSNFSRDEIMAIVSMGEREGSILPKESTLISNLFKLKNVKAKDVMTPRSVVFALDKNITIKEALEEDNIYIYSRIPIYDNTVDDIVGMTLNQTILEESIENNTQKKMSDILINVHKVPENIRVSNLIDLFVKKKTHLFVVNDKYGQTSGVVTLEDVIEALLGVEIMDELDEVENMQNFAKNRKKVIRNKRLVHKIKIDKHI